jgi:hypothetical protein
MIIRKNILVLLAALVMSSATAVQAGPIVSREHGIETSTDSLLMPTSMLGSVTLTCATCVARSYRLSNDTVLQIGQRNVTLQEFTAFAKGAKENAMLFVKAGADPVVTRITVSVRPTALERQ